MNMPEPQSPVTRTTHFGFKANPMDRLFISHGGLSSLCFDRNAFFDDAFDVDEFLGSHTQRGIPLEVLKEDLSTYRKIVQSALVQLVDREYADFVHLSSSLIGVDKGIESLRTPLENHLRRVEGCLAVLRSHMHVLDAKLHRKSSIQAEKHLLRCLLSAMKCSEVLVTVSRNLQDTASSKDRIPLLFRISDLLVRICKEEAEIAQTVWFSNMKSQLSFIDAAFTKILGEQLLVATKSREARIIQTYCLVYQHLDRISVAYQVISDGAVRPLLSSIIRDNQLKKSTFSALLSDISAVIQEHFYSFVYVHQADLILECVWTTLSGLLTTEVPSYLAPDQADPFRINYSAAKAFLNKFVDLFSAVRKDFAVKFWQHHATVDFLDKWSFPVYYQVRFLEIATPVEESMLKDVRKSVISGNNQFQLEITAVTWQAIQRCWHSDVCLAELVHRFWKLSLLLIARYISCLRTFQTDSDVASRLPAVLTDLSIFRGVIMELPGRYVRPVLEADGRDFEPIELVLKDSLQVTLDSLQQLENEFVRNLANNAAAEVTIIVKAVQDTPRLYRRTNREAPSSAASYVDSAFELLQHKLKQSSSLSPGQQRTGYFIALNDVLSQFSSLVLDLLDSVRRMEDSLKKLRKTRFTADAGLTDDDKIRLQLSLDVSRIELWIVQLGFHAHDFPVFVSAKERILSEKPDQSV